MLNFFFQFPHLDTAGERGAGGAGGARGAGEAGGAESKIRVSPSRRVAHFNPFTIWYQKEQLFN